MSIAQLAALICDQRRSAGAAAPSRGGRRIAGPQPAVDRTSSGCGSSISSTRQRGLQPRRPSGCAAQLDPPALERSLRRDRAPPRGPARRRFRAEGQPAQLIAPADAASWRSAYAPPRRTRCERLADEAARRRSTWRGARCCASRCCGWASASMCCWLSLHHIVCRRLVDGGAVPGAGGALPRPTLAGRARRAAGAAASSTPTMPAGSASGRPAMPWSASSPTGDSGSPALRRCSTCRPTGRARRSARFGGATLTFALTARAGRGARGAGRRRGRRCS